MKKKLSVIQMILLILAAILPNVDGMFTWISYNMYENLSKSSMSLNNLMTVQRIGPGTAFFTLFYIFIGITALYCILQLFTDNKVWYKKGWLSLSLITLLINTVMMIGASNHKDTYTYNGELRNVAVTLEVMGYIELIILVAVVVIDAYKLYKLCDE